MTSFLVRLIALTEEVEFDPNDVTPTWLGFLITFLVVAVTVLLVWDMTRRIRRTRYREEVREQLAAEEAEAAATRDESAG